MSDLFNNCSSLLTLPDISKWNYNNIIDISDIMKDLSFTENNSVYSNNSNNNNICFSYKDIDNYFTLTSNHEDYYYNYSNFG